MIICIRGFESLIILQSPMMKIGAIQLTYGHVLRIPWTRNMNNPVKPEIRTQFAER